ncbi:restriction endonuclease subunit S [Pseudomonas sp. SWRI81]|uniref:restriction endonuclease subunit S n=1 Tax=Pseudomonas sp. SWRI81 TaxID=2745505 RepID=UPI001646646B|nr:restriction endonuclease subunit S [Pseudomonas sp. SWRI81]MBC3271905.1 restriction endonuclease subunit S [Pseudomonas sp. SWRI81]
MSKDMGKMLVPKLRFPEFLGAGEWSVKKLGEVASLITEKAGSNRYTLMSVTAGVGLVTQIEKFGKEIAGAAYKNYYVIRKGDFAYNKSSTKEHPEGQMALLENISHGAVPNSIFICFRVDGESALPAFLKHPFATNIHGKWLRKFIAVGARANGALNVDSKYLLTLPVALPLLNEQQKIVDCLASIDELLNAQSKKVEALKIHKKCLIQQLFPREGESVPRLRFPEFMNAKKWDITPLGKAGRNFDSKRIPITEAERIKGNIPYYGASGVIDYVKDFIFDDELLCISEDGANLVARTYPIAFPISGKTWVNNHAHVLKFSRNSTQVLVENYLNSINIEDYLTGMAQPKLNRAKLDVIPIPLPEPDEQEKIADCLLSIDALIRAHSQKFDALRAHKKGLMQKLFPAADDVSA